MQVQEQHQEETWMLGGGLFTCQLMVRVPGQSRHRHFVQYFKRSLGLETGLYEPQMQPLICGNYMSLEREP